MVDVAQLSSNVRSAFNHDLRRGAGGTTPPCSKRICRTALLPHARSEVVRHADGTVEGTLLETSAQIAATGRLAHEELLDRLPPRPVLEPSFLGGRETTVHLVCSTGVAVHLLVSHDTS
jgi:hypothetical protein